MQRTEFRARVEQAEPQDGRESFRLVLATEQPATNGYRLSCADGAFSLPATGRVRLFVGHNESELPVGYAGEVEARDGRIVANLVRLSAGPEGERIRSDVAAEILTDVSVGIEFAADAIDDSGDDVFINRYRIREASFVGMGAIPGAGVLRNAEVINMREAENSAALRTLFQAFGTSAPVNELFRKAIEENMTVDSARDALGELFQRNAQPVKRGAGPVSIEAGEDARDKWHAAALQAVRIRTMTYSRDADGQALRAADRAERHANPFTGLDLVGLAQEACAVMGWRPRNRDEAVKLAIFGKPETNRQCFATPDQNVSDYTSVITTNVNAALAIGYSEADETYAQWTSVKPMNDFRQHDFPVMSLFPDLDQINLANGSEREYQHASLDDKAESMTLNTYGKLIGITRRLIINDSLAAFSDIPRKMGRAAARKEGDLVYALLTSQPTMAETSRLLCNTTDGNKAASGGALSVTTLDAGELAMRTRTDPSTAATLGTRPRFLIVPVSIANSARVLVAAEKDPSVASGEQPNPFFNRLTVVDDHRLTSTNWFLAADPASGDVETIARGYLNGQDAPYTEMMDGFERDGVVHKVRFDVAVAALDWRGMYENAGA